MGQSWQLNFVIAVTLESFSEYTIVGNAKLIQHVCHSFNLKTEPYTGHMKSENL